MTKFDVYLASQSPRRRELLNQIGISVIVLTVDVDESAKENENASEYVIRLAKEKALAGWENKTHDNKVVLAADTAVVINDVILGKPVNHHDARRMLRLLSGHTHQVMSAVALAATAKNSSPPCSPELSCVISVSNVTFKALSDREIEHYISSGECDDKAGSYAIQGLAAVFITHLSGSYSGVMGLPLYETTELLKKAGIRSDFLVVS